MAIRRVSFLNRKKIKKSDYDISIINQNSTLTFDAILTLTEYSFPNSARIVIEAYRQTNWMRFEFGNVGNLQHPENRMLSEFDSEEGIKFRVKVISEDENKGVLLGEADKINPKLSNSTGDEISLLPVQPSSDLQQEIFRLEFDFEPRLLVNSNLGDWRSLLLTPTFYALVFPDILRQILNRILLIDNQNIDIDDKQDWRVKWILFTKNIPGVQDFPNSDDVNEIDYWIDESVAAFCRYKQLKEKFSLDWERS